MYGLGVNLVDNVRKTCSVCHFQLQRVEARCLPCKLQQLSWIQDRTQTSLWISLLASTGALYVMMAYWHPTFLDVEHLCQFI